MQKWEYCILRFVHPDARRVKEGILTIWVTGKSEETVFGGEAELFEIIVRLGEDGWVVANSISHAGFTQYLFKRPWQELTPTSELVNLHILPSKLQIEIAKRMNDLIEKMVGSYLGEN